MSSENPGRSASTPAVSHLPRVSLSETFEQHRSVRTAFVVLALLNCLAAAYYPPFQSSTSLWATCTLYLPFTVFFFSVGSASLVFVLSQVVSSSNIALLGLPFPLLYAATIYGASRESPLERLKLCFVGLPPPLVLVAAFVCVGYLFVTFLMLMKLVAKIQAY